jgi:predicted membrane protein
MDPSTLLSFDPWTLFWGFVFSVIGFGYYRYGKRQGDTVMLIAGVVLMVYPLFVTSSVIVAVIGVILTAGPVMAKRLGG